MKRLLVCALLLLLASSAGAANTVSWSGDVDQPGHCATVRFDTSNAANESKMLQIGGGSISIQSDGDAAGSGASESDLYVCTSSDGNRDGVQDSLACAGLGFVDTDSDGFLDDNTLDGGATPGRRGLLLPISVAGFLYIDPIGATITGSEVHEVTVCAVR